MVVLSFCLHRLPQLSREEFQRYWREEHAPLVARHSKVLRIERYVQLHSVEPSLNEAFRVGRGGPEEYDGIAQLWWSSVEDLVQATASDEGRRAGEELLADERRFIDLARSPLWLSREHPVVGG
ncbi:MAG: EthD domain-containing protein [Myxococcota bacterium]